MATNGGWSFEGAPLTRLIILSCLLTTLAFRYAHGEHAGAYCAERRHIAGAFITSTACGEFGWVNAGAAEFLFGLSTLRTASKTLERRLGTSRYFAFVVAIRIVYAILMKILMTIVGGGGGENDDGFALFGPYWLTFAALAAYGEETPPVLRFDGPFGTKLSDKTFQYAPAFALAMSAGKTSAYAAMVGAFAGYVLTHGVGLAHPDLVTPQFIARPTSRIFGRKGPTVRVRLGSGIAPPASRTAPVLVTPSEENVQLLVGMGFDQAASRRALAQAGDDVQRATNLLLASS
jgi:hypothetical protein